MKPVDSTAQGCMSTPQLQRDEREALFEDGYVVLRNLVSEEHVRAARRFINRRLGQGYTFDPKIEADGRLLAQMQTEVEVPAVSNAFNRTEILPLVESMLGSVDLVRSETVQVALRFPQPVRITYQPHIDGEYAAPDIRSFSLLAVVFLSDCLDTDMGNLTLIPGSHRELGRFFAEGGDGLKERLKDGTLDSVLSANPDFSCSLQSPKQIQASAGDVVLFHGLLAHGVAPNTSPDIRYALIARFVPHGLDLDDFEANWRRLVAMWGEWPGMHDEVQRDSGDRFAAPQSSPEDPVRVIHVTSPHNGDSDVSGRVELFYESVERAYKSHVKLVAASADNATVKGWQTAVLERSARAVGDDSSKPFIKDLFDIALEQAGPRDWLLLSNCDCPIAPDLYRDLRNKRGTVVEYMRRNVPRENSATLERLFEAESCIQDNGIDGLAIRAGYYREIRDSLPNALVGAPHWDTLYSGILRRLGPVRSSVDKLFHPEHEPTWNVDTPASRYNSEIYEEALKYGDLARATISVEPECTDTAVVMVSFGNDPARIQAHRTALARQLKQDLFCDFYIVELLVENEESIYPAELLDDVHHIAVRGSDRNRDLFQKEALMNIGWKAALDRQSYEYFVFVDADVYARDYDWFRRIRDRLVEDPRRLVQGFRLMEDTEDPRLKYSAFLAAEILGFQTDLETNPGLCWGVHRQVLEQGDGFNPLYLDGSGDSGFICEYIQQSASVYDHGLARHRWTNRIRRDVDVDIVPDCVPVDVVHINHGPVTMRNYNNVHHAVGAFEKAVDELVFLNDSGLLEWKDPDCRERRILRERDRLATPEAIDTIFEQHGYGRDRAPLVGVSRRRSLWSRSSGSGYQAIFQRWSRTRGNKDSTSRGLYIFNPTRVFNKHFPYSWCCQVKNSNSESRIPLNGSTPLPELVLDAADGCEWFAAALPLAQSWSPVDLSGYERLEISAAVSRCPSAKLGLRLVSVSEAGVEQRSAEVVLEIPEPDVFHLFTTALCKFANEELDFERVRLVELLGHGNYRARLTRIVFEQPAPATIGSY